MIGVFSLRVPFLVYCVIHLNEIKREMFRSWLLSHVGSNCFFDISRKCLELFYTTFPFVSFPLFRTPVFTERVGLPVNIYSL